MVGMRGHPPFWQGRWGLLAQNCTSDLGALLAESDGQAGAHHSAAEVAFPETWSSMGSIHHTMPPYRKATAKLTRNNSLLFRMTPLVNRNAARP